MSTSKFFVAAAALVLGACAAPTLDTAGVIECGGTGGTECPPNFTCEWGRCCPNGSTTCPTTLPRDTTGTMYLPDAAGNCPPNYEKRFDQYCCPSDAGAECPARVIGAHCTAPTDCDAPSMGSMPFCLSSMLFAGVNFPNGYCVATGCDVMQPLTSCGPIGVCVPGSMAGSSVCVRRCMLPSPGAIYGGACPDSNGELGCYGDPANPSTIGYCAPDCGTNPMLCGAGTECVPEYHVCLRPCRSGGVACPSGTTCGPLMGTTPPRDYCLAM